MCVLAREVSQSHNNASFILAIITFESALFMRRNAANKRIRGAVYVCGGSTRARKLFVGTSCIASCWRGERECFQGCSFRTKGQNNRHPRKHLNVKTEFSMRTRGLQRRKPPRAEMPEKVNKNTASFFQFYEQLLQRASNGRYHTRAVF